MKVLFLNYEYPPLGGGAANATEYLLREYARTEGLEVHLVTSAIGNGYAREEIGDRVIVHRIPIGKNPSDLHHQSRANLLSYTVKGYLFARKLVREEGGFDLIHAFFTIPGGFQSLLLRAEFRLPYVVSLRGADVPGYSERFPVIYAFVRPIVRLIWNRAAAVVSNSEGLRELAGKTSPNLDIPVIPNGVDTGQFKPESRTSSDGFRILAVSRLTPRKGIRFLIRAMRPLREAYPDRGLELLIAGGGDEEESLKALAVTEGVSDVVRFLGRVPHDGLPQVYRDSDVFCLPSLNEGMSNTVLEAIASGLPIVATVTGGTEELVRDGENGFFVAMESPEDLAEKLGRLVADPALRARMGEASRAHAETMSWSSVAGRYADLYRSVE
ncbi:MAG: glycosyltransferase family 4 protein [Candidatus Moranbacteria bacterium]|nr:glycosyltransferase family 4 protein [Candidatus Moranbacteria bacterium]